jgi:hypothetical protein
MISRKCHHMAADHEDWNEADLLRLDSEHGCENWLTELSRVRYAQKRVKNPSFKQDSGR